MRRGWRSQSSNASWRTRWWFDYSARDRSGRSRDRPQRRQRRIQWWQWWCWVGCGTMSARGLPLRWSAMCMWCMVLLGWHFVFASPTRWAWGSRRRATRLRVTTTWWRCRSIYNFFCRRTLLNFKFPLNNIPNHGQWWSKRMTQLKQQGQCEARGGR